jgi:hypothetical protein
VKEDTDASIELAKDSRTIALATKHDSSSMKNIAFMTMAFLPATFFAALFTLPIFDWESTPMITQKFWVYWATTVPTTLLVFALWYMITKQKEIRERKENQRQRDEVSQSYRKGYTMRGWTYESIQT